MLMTEYGFHAICPSGSDFVVDGGVVEASGASLLKISSDVDGSEMVLVASVASDDIVGDASVVDDESDKEAVKTWWQSVDSNRRRESEIF